MKKHIIKIIKIMFVIIISVLIIGFALMWGLIILTFNLEQKKLSEKRIKKEITTYLDKNLDDNYEIKNIIKENDEETIYSIYIPDDDITVPIKYHHNNNSFQGYWEVDGIDFEVNYYNIKFIKASNDRKALLKKYPDITEKITYNYHKTPEFNIYVNDIEHIDEIYGYLTDSYKLNNYKLYTDIEYADSDDSNNNDKKGNRYFDDYSIEVHIFVDNKEVLNMQYSDIREKFECKQEELYNFIPKEKLIEQIENNYNGIIEYGVANIQWRK